MGSDLRFALRLLRRDWLFAAMALLTLALGIGANTTMFSVVNAVLLRPIPGYQTGRLLRITDGDPRFRAGFIPAALYPLMLKTNRSFESIAAQQFCPYNLTGIGEPEQLTSVCSSANWFALQHAPALLGRTFAPDEDRHGRARVVVLSYAYWQRKFRGSSHVVGRLITLNGAPWTIIGVMPADFKPLNASDIAIFTPNVIADNPAGLIVVGRLKSAASMAQAQAELKAFGDRLGRSDPGEWKGTRLLLTPVLEQITGGQKPLLMLLMGAVGFVFLIACVNVANLLLARARAREQEIRIRAALGASWGRIVRFLLTEVLLLCSLASVAALAIAYLGLAALRPLLNYLPRAGEITLDTKVFVWALAMGWVATVLAGCLPAVRAAKLSSGTAAATTRVTSRWHTGLLAMEVALALVLLIGAGLLIRTFANLRMAPLGYDPSDTLTTFLALPEHADAGNAERTYSRIRERLRAIPGVEAVATGSSTPAGGVDMSIDIEAEGVAPKSKAATATVNIVSRDYFRTLGIRVQSGRSFTDDDRAGAMPVAVVSNSIARRYFQGKAVGRRIQIPDVNFALTDAHMVWGEIVGVVDSVAVTSPGERTAEHVYLPEAQHPVRFTYILVRARANGMQLAPQVRHAVYSESPSTPLDETESMVERSSYLTAGSRRATWLLGVFAALAGVLAIIGIYAVSSYLSAQRTREMAIRMAVGADAWSVAEAVCGRPLRAMLSGIAAGLLGALLLTRLLASLLFGVSAVDPVTYGSAAGILFLFGSAAMIRPMFRVLLTDVAATLRQE